MFRVKVTDSPDEQMVGTTILAHLSGKMRMHYIRVMPGDRVRDQPLDLFVGVRLPEAADVEDDAEPLRIHRVHDFDGLFRRAYEVVVIGSGPGGYVAAIRAAQLGMKTAVVEREHMGGICLNWGCIPTKALLRTSEVYGLIKHADSFGLSVKDVSYDAKKVVERSRKVANQLSNGVKGLMRKNKITVFDGTAKLAGVDGGQRKLAVAMNSVRPGPDGRGRETSIFAAAVAISPSFGFTCLVTFVAFLFRSALKI